MKKAASFDEVLDAIEHWPEDQQADLVEVVRRRLAERGRQRLIADARKARQEHASGQTREVSVDKLMREIES
jgi:hypothetical protein